MFTHLHTHSYYSLLDGLSSIDALLDRCQELGMTSLAITDHGNMYGIIEFYKAAKKRGIKPIIGCEMYVAPDGMLLKKTKQDAANMHLILLAKNNTGYTNLIKMVTKANLDGFYYKPRIDRQLLREHSEGLIGLSACAGGEIPQAILSGKEKKIDELIKDYTSIFAPGCFYLELQHHPNSKDQAIVNDGLIALSKKYNLPLVATNDIHYAKPEDKEAQDVLICIQTNRKVSEENRMKMTDFDLHMNSPAEMATNFSHVPEAIANTQKIADECNVEIELGNTKLPNFVVPEGYTDTTFLHELCEKGLIYRYEENITPAIRERLSYELSIIDKTGFASYFLIVNDFVMWAKNNGIVVGPGRGSAAGSLVAYLLRITDIDPLTYNLLFERFLNPARISMPDIDMDFADIGRDKVLRYVSEKYGRDHVAQIISFGTMAARAAVRDTGRALGYEYSLCNEISQKIPMFCSIDKALEVSAELKEIYEKNEDAKKLIDFAKKMEGVKRHASTHACGVVITKDPLYLYTPCQKSSHSEENITTQYEMHAIEDLGLLKMDFLGLSNLTTLEKAIQLIKQTSNIEIKLDKIPLDDETTYTNTFKKGQTTGVFQMECLSGETIISNTTLKKMFEQKNKAKIESIYLDEGAVHKNQILDIVSSGEKEVYTLIGENDWYIKATLDHYFLTKNGWEKLGNIKKGEEILIKSKAKHLVFNTCQQCGKQINGQKEGKSKYCYQCSAQFYSNPSKPQSRLHISNAQKKFYKNGGTTWNMGLTKETSKILNLTAKKISEALVGRTFEDLYGVEKAKAFKKNLSEKMTGQNNPMFGQKTPHRKGGYREDLGHYVRSSWEADFARILKFYNIKYKYEPKTFQIKKSNNELLHYTPDFYVESKNTFYEIKGWMHDEDKEKIDLFQEQYPQYHFELISATRFAELALKYKKIIAWECPRIPIKTKFEFIKVKDIKYSNKEMTYDIIMKPPGNNFIANGFVVHNSNGMKRYLKQLKPTNIEDIIAMVALYRPGPMDLIPDFIDRKHGIKKIEYIHPKLEPILKNTYGIAIYQEQLMQMARDLAGFSLAEADILRKAIGKKIKTLLDEQKIKLIKGMIDNGVSKNIAQQIWKIIEPFASYGFNRSHAACYALIGYWTAYFKTHYPAEFMCALLISDQGNLDRATIEIDECKMLGIDILPPDINKSFENFSIETKDNKKCIRFGFNAIKNVGENISQEIVKERNQNGEFLSIENLATRITSRDMNKKSLEAFAKCGALENFGERNKILNNISQILSYTKELQTNKAKGQDSLFSLMPAQETITESSLSLSLIDTEPATKNQRLAWEKELLGLYISEHPLEDYKKYLEKYTTACKNLTDKDVGKDVRIGGIISRVKKIPTKKQKMMAFAELEDLTSKVEVVIFPKTFAETLEIWELDNIILVSGKVDNRDGTIKILCEGASKIMPQAVLASPATN